MGSKRRLLILSAPVVAGAVLLGSALVLRGGRGAPPRSSTPTSPRAHCRVVPSGCAEASVRTAGEALPRSSPPEAVARAVGEVRLRSVFQNFRTAVATGNEALAGALRPILLREFKAVLRLAQEEEARAGTPADREVARKTLQALRRSP